MANIETLRTAVADLYGRKDPSRDEWADWLYEYHVLWVATKTRELAEKYGADPDMAEAAALLHDIADAIMARRSENHEEESLRLARELLVECNYDETEIARIVDDADRYHSCHDGKRPESTEGLVLATADAMAHFQTDFYPYAFYQNGKEGRNEYEKALGWAREKIERDYHSKILFDDEKREVCAAYETLRALFS